MNSALLLHDSTRRAVDTFIDQPTHALLLVAPTGMGKSTVAQYIACKLLGTTEIKLENHPYFKLLRSANSKTISIEAIRDAIHFTALRTAGSTARVIIIEDSHLMTLQAQNALLKTLEEPPAGTTIILTAPSELSLLPTIRSRVLQISLQMPASDRVVEYFKDINYPEPAVKKALLMSGGLPGLMHALLDTGSEHPLLAATDVARDILQKSTYDRLLLVDGLAKQKQLWLDTLFILGQMADIAIRQGSSNIVALRRWHKILTTCNEATSQSLRNAQTKLVLLNFMLSL